LNVCLEDTGYIESWGLGIEKIKIECKTADAREPEIKYDFGGVMVTFAGEVPVTSDNRAEGSEKTTEKTTEKSSEKGSEKGSEKASEKTSEKTSEKILRSIIGNKNITIAELAEIAGVAPRSIERNIQRLQGQGLIRRIGPDKGGHWEVVDKK
jgi:ATP-dependent DNA helicase RecG